MGGVYIPNMSKPKDCYLCEFTNGYECWSNGEPWFDVKEAYAKRTLSPNCPLIEIDLVRCGECKYMRKYALRSADPTGIWCHRWSVPRLITDADFCSYGERRSDET